MLLLLFIFPQLGLLVTESLLMNTVRLPVWSNKVKEKKRTITKTGTFRSGSCHHPGHRHFLLPQTQFCVASFPPFFNAAVDCCRIYFVTLMFITVTTFMTDWFPPWRPTAAVPPQSLRVWRPNGGRSSVCCGSVSSVPGTVGECSPATAAPCYTDT